MDVLTDALNAVQLKGWISARRELTPPWRYVYGQPGYDLSPLGSGGATCRSKASTPLRVESGAVLLLFPFGTAHLSVII